MGPFFGGGFFSGGFFGGIIAAAETIVIRLRSLTERWRM